MGCCYRNYRVNIRTIVTLPVTPPTMLAQNVIGSAFAMRFNESHSFFSLSPLSIAPAALRRAVALVLCCLSTRSVI